MIIVLCYCTIRDSGDIYGRRGVERERNGCSKEVGKNKVGGRSEVVR